MAYALQGMFPDHPSDRIRNRLRNKNSDLVIIPSGNANQLQPFDVSVNKQCKHLSCKHYVAWVNKDSHLLTHSGKLKRASASMIVEGISKAWNEVPLNIILKSFLKYSLSNVEDGMQDDIL
jgi:hypothetical protein